MGYMRHHAIVVTSYDEDRIVRAHEEAHALFDAEDYAGRQVAQVGPLTDASVNCFQSFLVAPDGSKEGWDESDRGDAAREAFVAWLDAQRYSDNSSSIDWVEVQYGDENHETKVVNDSHAQIREHGYGED